jgi:aldehyde:ferredoxin oxidoreductase
MDLEGRRLKKQDLNYLLDEFYSIKGWDLSSGIPTREKLEKVDLKDVADELDKLGLYSSPP